MMLLRRLKTKKKKDLKLLQMESKLLDYGDYQKIILFENIILNNYSTRDVIEKYKEYNFDIIKKHYVVMDIKNMFREGN